MAEVRSPGSNPGELERVEAPSVAISGLGIAGSLADFVESSAHWCRSR